MGTPAKVFRKGNHVGARKSQGQLKEQWLLVIAQRLEAAGAKGCGSCDTSPAEIGEL